jgi:ribonucleoside-diphosphate reductase alpha chain
MQVTKRNGTTEALDISKIQKATEWACRGLDVSQSELELSANIQFFDGMKTSQIHSAVIGSAAGMISVECQDATFAAARLVLLGLYKEAWQSIEYPHLAVYIDAGIGSEKLNPALARLFVLEDLNDAIRPERDELFNYIGIQTLADRYLIRNKARRVIELPQHFFMRVAMGLALREADPTARAIEFYNVLSTFDFMSSTPTLFNAGTNHSQLASCFLNTVADTLDAEEDEEGNFKLNRFASIYGTITECGNLSKFAGGIGTDWNRVRGEGDWIAGTDGISSGIVPYLKVYNDTAVAVNQGGKRQGSFAPYLELWHPDAYDFMDLKKESGDERRRAHDIYPAWWGSDLFFKRVQERGTWSFFSPKSYPELHELHGDAFEARYIELEAAGAFVRQVPVMDMWKRMLASLFETGHPWITFKDECNRRNPQQHVGVIHSSNLCTEITLNTSDDETAVCNIGSINGANHVKDGKLDTEKLRKTARTAMRMLDNVIDINFYPSPRAKKSNLRHRPVGLGLMGYTEYLVQLGVDWESQGHLDAADELLEHMSFYAIEASCDLARERGAYETFPGSLWSKGILPMDTGAKDVRAELVTREIALPWDELRQNVVTYGMRNSNTMAIAPTATISNIVGTTPTIEPIFQREYTKKNQSGNFVVVDPCLRYGRPELCKESFEINPFWMIDSGAVRQFWIDQSQSLNIFVPFGIKGKDLSEIYLRAWKRKLKTTYYLRGQSATKVETPAIKEQHQTPGDTTTAELRAATPRVQMTQAEEDALELAVLREQRDYPGDEDMSNKLCSLDNPDCESCQ